MSEIEPAKHQAARAAAALVEAGMVIGLGSGTTASLTIGLLGQRLRDEGLGFVGVPTSAATATMARTWGIELRQLDDVRTLDLNLDGADEVDQQFRMIKGRGGALLREKIVASTAKRRVAIITAEKRVAECGATMPLPVEVSCFGLRHTEARLVKLGATTSIRRRSDGSTFETDGGNAIIDCWFPTISDPEGLERELRRVVGVLDTGFFFGLCDLLVVGHPDRADLIEAPPAL